MTLKANTLTEFILLVARDFINSISKGGFFFALLANLERKKMKKGGGKKRGIKYTVAQDMLVSDLPE